MKAQSQFGQEPVFYSFFKRLLALSIPLSLSRMIYLLSNFVAVFMLGKLGKLPLAAGVLSVSTFAVIMVFTSAIFRALSILIRKTPKTPQAPAQVMALFHNSIFLSLGIGLLAGCFLWHADQLLLLTGQAPALVAMAKPYFHLAALAIAPGLLVSVMNQLIVGTGSASSLLYIELLSFGPRVLLFYGFIYGSFGLPALGIAGIALTEILVKSAVFLLLSVYLGLGNRYQPYRHYLTMPHWHYNHQLIKNLLFLGLPIALQSSGEIAAMSVAGYLMGHFGITALAALSVTNQYMIPVMMLANGLSQAMTLFMSELKANPQSQTANHICLQAGLCIFILFAMPFIVLFINYPMTLLTLFVPTGRQDAALQSLTTSFFVIITFFISVEGLRSLIIGALWAISNSSKAVLSSLLIIWFIGLPVSYLFAFTFHGGPIGLRLGLLSGLIISLTWLGFNLLNQLPRTHEYRQVTSQG